VFQHGVGVEFVRFLPETHPPVLSNVFCELGACENVVSITLFYYIKNCVAIGRNYTLYGTSFGTFGPRRMNDIVLCLSL